LKKIEKPIAIPFPMLNQLLSGEYSSLIITHGIALLPQLGRHGKNPVKSFLCFCTLSPGKSSTDFQDILHRSTFECGAAGNFKIPPAVPFCDV
jgi:hypothetical protein